MPRQRMLPLAIALGFLVGVPLAPAAELTDRIDALPIGTTEYGDVAEAVLASGSRELAERLLLRVADVDVWGAAERGELPTLRLVGLGDPDRLRMSWTGGRGRQPLHIAMSFGQPEAMRFLLEATRWSRPEKNDSHSPFDSSRRRQQLWYRFRDDVFAAARKGRLEIVKLAAESGFDLAESEYDGTVLHLAAGSVDGLPLVRWLIEQGVDVNARSKNGSTPLHQAGWRGHVEICRALLEAGADPTLRTNWGYTPLHGALWGDENEVVELLRERVPLDVYSAAGLGYVESLERLWSKPFPENLEGSVTIVPLSLAARRGKVEAVRWLLAENRTPKQPGKFGPLHHACRAGHLEIVKLLLDAGYGLEEVGAAVSYDDEGTPLEIASRNGHRDLVEFLLERGANVDGVPLGKSGDFSGVTSPLTAAAQSGHVEVVRVLLDAGARIDLTADDIADHRDTGEQDNPLYAAAKDGQLEACRVLVERGASIDGVTRSWSPLHAAASGGHLAVCRFLVEQGADVDIGRGAESRVVATVRGREIRRTDGIGTPLHSAAREGRIDVLRFLLKAGAEVNEVGTYEGCTPLSLAIDQLGGRTVWDRWDDRAETVRVLVAAGGRAIGRSSHAKLSYLGDPELIATLEERGVEFKRTQSREEERAKSLLVHAIRIGSKDVVRFLLANGVDPDGEVPSRLRFTRGTLLRFCGESGNKLAAIVMLEAGASPDPTAAGMAAAYGHVDTLRALVERGVTADTALAAAAREGRANVVKFLVDRGARLDDPEAGGKALRSAVMGGHVEMVDLLLRGGADPNARDQDDHFPLGVLATSGGRGSPSVLAGTDAPDDPTLAIATRLVKAGADVNARAKDGWNVTQLALRYDRPHLARQLVKEGVRADPWSAAALDDVESLRRFVRESPRYFKVRTASGAPLEWAAKYGAVEAVTLLLKSFPPMDGGPDGRRALFVASSRGHLEVVKLLLDAGVPADKGTPSSPLLAALAGNGRVPNERRIAIATLLVRHGADANAGEEGRDRPLHRAASLGDAGLVRDLLAAGAEPSPVGRDGRTPLHVAASGSKAEPIRALLGGGAKPNPLDAKGRTPLDLVGTTWVNDDEQEENFETCVRLLLDGDADVTAGLGSSVYMAARARHVDLVRELLERGAPVDSVDEYGRTALMTSLGRYANGGRDRRERSVEIIGVLLENGASTTAVDGQDRSVGFYLDYLNLDELRRRFPKLANVRGSKP